MPIPRGSPIHAALDRLDRATTYRMRRLLTSIDPQLMSSMQAAGLDRVEKVVAGPDLQMIRMDFQLPAFPPDAGKIDAWEVRAVIKGGRMARRFTSPSMPRFLALEREQIALQMGRPEFTAAPSIISVSSRSPWRALDDRFANAELLFGYASRSNRDLAAHQFFEWRCSDAPGGTAKSPAPVSMPLTDMVDLGASSAGDIPVHSYQFYVTVHLNGPVPVKLPVELAVAQRTGLPVRIEITDGGGTEVMEFYDYGQPATIEIPPCLNE
jgi:hypothetical protein